MQTPTRTHGRAIGFAAARLLGWATLILVGWNLALPDLTGLDEIRFRHAFGLALLLTAASGLVAALPRRRRFRTPNGR
ncbi:MAG: hypothetical protein D6761_00980 [Candidatus Dadabacteria bacterium]|nr:MAG: hypothetical protein D6761_00980 [Candidatus Dadabacteria bacterium]